MCPIPYSPRPVVNASQMSPTVGEGTNLPRITPTVDLKSGAKAMASKSRQVVRLLSGLNRLPSDTRIRARLKALRPGTVS
jgi:hypothetical protein